MAVLGLIFLAIVVAETFWRPSGPAGRALVLAGWAMWFIFLAEFVLRALMAPSIGGFLKRNWWHLIFLTLPFLRGLRLLRIFRVARAGRVVGSAVRTTRSAARTLTGRIAWLGAVHAVVVVSSAQLIIEFTPVRSPLHALYLAARGAVSGEPFGVDSAAARVIEIVLATYAVIVFAALAGSLGAYLIERRNDQNAVVG